MREVKLIWKQGGKLYSKMISENDISYYMEGFKKGFDLDNEASTRILKVRPDVKEIRIDNDINEYVRDPYIFYTKTNGYSDIIKIRKRNKLVWFILNDVLCSL